MEMKGMELLVTGRYWNDIGDRGRAQANKRKKSEMDFGIGYAHYTQTYEIFIKFETQIEIRNTKKLVEKK